MDNSYQVPRLLVPLVGIALLSLFWVPNTGVFTGLVAIALLLGVHRFIGGLWGTVWSAFGLMMLPVWLFAQLMPGSRDILAIAATIIFVGLYVCIRLFGLYKQDEDSNPLNKTSQENDSILQPLTPQSYIERAAHKIEQASKNTNTTIDEGNIYIYRDKKLWGIAWAFPDGSGLQPAMVTELSDYRRELGLATAALIAPTFNDQTRVAAGQHRVKLISV